VVQYVGGDTIPQEAPYEIEERKPPAQWPEHGAVEFDDVKMSYRPGLPNVLRGISVKIKGGEKIGIVGRSAALLDSDLHLYANAVILRTGAGKSSLMLALFRIVELSGGSITIDGYVVIARDEYWFSHLLVSIYLQSVLKISAPRFL
jgi:ABC-type multidrug transport system fused ATPase/permease subunit